MKSDLSLFTNIEDNLSVTYVKLNFKSQYEIVDWPLYVKCDPHIYKKTYQALSFLKIVYWIWK